MNTSSKKNLCDEAFHLQTNILFQLTQTVVVLLDITGIFLAIYVSSLILLIKVFHINLRVLLVSLFVLLIIRSLFTLYRSVGFIYRYAAHKDKCSFLEESVTCRVLSELATAPNKCLPFTFLAIALERAAATFLYNRYEKWRSPVALVLIPLTWFEIALSIRRTLPLLLQRNGSDRKSYKSYCSSINAHVVDHFGIIFVNIPTILACFALFSIFHVISKRKMKLHLASTVDSLSSRYQIMENIRTSQTMLITSSLYTICVICNLGGVLLLAVVRRPDIISFALFKEATSFGIPVFVNGFSLLLILKVNSIRIRTVRWLRCATRTADVQSTGLQKQDVTPEQHLEILQNMWTFRNR